MSEEKSTTAKREDERPRRNEDRLPDLTAKNEEQVKGGLNFTKITYSRT